MGAFVGLAGDFSPLATFRAGLGVTRSLFYDSSSSTYTPFLPTATGSYKVGDQFWNSSSLLGITVPFRYGLDGTIKTSGDIYSVNGTFQIFSDPSFTSDFYTRSEASLLSSLLNQATTATTTTTTTTAATQSNLSWDLDGKLDFAKLVNVPFITSLAVQDLDLKATWLSYTPSGLTAPASKRPGKHVLLSFEHHRTQHFPFFQRRSPVSRQLPHHGPANRPRRTTAAARRRRSRSGAQARPPAASATSTAGHDPDGRGHRLPGTAAAGRPDGRDDNPPRSTAEKPDPGKGFRSPFQNAASAAKTDETKTHSEFRDPSDQPDSKLQSSSQASTLKISYQIQPRATLDHTFDTTNWTSQSAVDYGILYRTFETGGSGSITAASTLFGTLADVSLGLNTTDLWRLRFDPSSGEAASSAWQTLLLNDAEQDQLALHATAQGTIRPFSSLPELSSSSIAYKLGLRLYELSLTGSDPLNQSVVAVGPGWSSDDVSEHSVNSVLSFSNALTTDSLTFLAQLPPLVPTMTASANAGLGGVKAKVQGGLSLPSTGVLYQPLIMDGSIDFGSNITASEELQFDLTTSALSLSTSQLSLGALTGSFVAEEGATVGSLIASSMKIGYESSAGDELVLGQSHQARLLLEDALEREPPELSGQPFRLRAHHRSDDLQVSRLLLQFVFERHQNVPLRPRMGRRGGRVMGQPARRSGRLFRFLQRGQSGPLLRSRSAHYRSKQSSICLIGISASSMRELPNSAPTPRTAG